MISTRRSVSENSLAKLGKTKFPQDDRLANDAIRSGEEISEEEYRGNNEEDGQKEEPKAKYKGNKKSEGKSKNKVKDNKKKKNMEILNNTLNALDVLKGLIESES